MACMTCGYYATHLIMMALTLPADFIGAAGAAAGFVGLSLAEAALGAVDSIDVRALFARVIKRWLP